MNYPAIRIEGAILSPDIFGRIEDLTGQKPSDFTLASGIKVKDEIARAWADAQDYYRIFHRKLDTLRPTDPATSETRQQWVIPFLALLGYQLDFQPRAAVIHDKTYAISHRATNRAQAPVHIVGYREPAGLDRKPENATLRMSAHAIVQEFLNLNDQLYGLVTNGRILRLLRDSSRLIKLSYLEFDLDRIFTDGLFADFAVLYRLLHATRLPAANDGQKESWIERYHQESLDSGARIREGLSTAVESAIRDFGNGFLSHPDNTSLREAVADRTLKATDYYQNLLRLIYRLLFLMVIEERDLVFPPTATQSQRDVYRRYYSLQRLRLLSEHRYLADARRHDLWLALLATFRLFDDGGPGAKLGLAPLAGDLFGHRAIPKLINCTLGNDVLLKCLRSLSVYESPVNKQLIRVNYGALNVEEFGSVYEGLLEFKPVFVDITRKPEFNFQQGGERAATGSHYTPDDLVQPLIKHSLDYLIADCLKATGTRDFSRVQLPGSTPHPLSTTATTAPSPTTALTRTLLPNPDREGGASPVARPTPTTPSPIPTPAETALLNLRIADIACGSGHILLAAARRIATELAIVRTGEEQPSPTAFRAALRDVIRTCIYGVDLNPLAVELCKVALWLEAHSPGQPLNFLDHHIKCGNAIVGFVRQEELDKGIPTEAFATMPGDDKELAAKWRNDNKRDRADVRQMRLAPSIQNKIEVVLKRSNELSALPERTPAEIEAKKDRFLAFTNSFEVGQLEAIAAMPIAQFYIPKTPDHDPELMTDSKFREFWNDGLVPAGQPAATAQAIASDKRFFHWFLEFPDIIARGGFDCILGNPPYLGRGGIRSTYGNAFCGYVQWAFMPAGISDIVVFFVRRIFEMLTPAGFMAFITTNSIKDGEIRKDGLDQVVRQGAEINMAVRAIRWPGRANLFVSLLAIGKRPWRGPRTLDGVTVPLINTFFEDGDAGREPRRFPINADRVAQGSIFLGDGFVLSDQDVTQLLTADPKNCDVICRLVNGQEINNEPDQEPRRHIINFREWGIGRASEYPEPFARLESLVQPDRVRIGAPENWWQFWRPRMDLYMAIRKLPRCFVAARTTKYLSFSATPTNFVFTDALYVFTTDRWDLYAVVQSTIHEVWARKYSGSLKQDLRYSPSKCFDTFAFPAGLWQTPNPTLATLGEHYHQHRKSLMLSLWLGLTDIYNLFHARDLSPAKVEKVSKKSPEEAERGYHGLLELRRLHVALDLAIRDAYGWQNLPLEHDFHEVETLAENDRVRYTISPAARKELLRRLLAENHARAAAESATAALTEKSPKPKRPRKSTQPEGMADMFPEE